MSFLTKEQIEKLEKAILSIESKNQCVSIHNMSVVTVGHPLHVNGYFCATGKSNLLEELSKKYKRYPAPKGILENNWITMMRRIDNGIDDKVVLSADGDGWYAARNNCSQSKIFGYFYAYDSELLQLAKEADKIRPRLPEGLDLDVWKGIQKDAKVMKRNEYMIAPCWDVVEYEPSIHEYPGWFCYMHSDKKSQKIIEWMEKKLGPRPRLPEGLAEKMWDTVQKLVSTLKPGQWVNVTGITNIHGGYVSIEDYKFYGEDVTFIKYDYFAVNCIPNKKLRKIIDWMNEKLGPRLPKGLSQKGWERIQKIAKGSNPGECLEAPNWTVYYMDRDHDDYKYLGWFCHKKSLTLDQKTLDMISWMNEKLDQDRTAKLKRGNTDKSLNMKEMKKLSGGDEKVLKSSHDPIEPPKEPCNILELQHRIDELHKEIADLKKGTNERILTLLEKMVQRTSYQNTELKILSMLEKMI